MLTRGRPTIVYPEQVLTFQLTGPVTLAADFNSEAFQPVSQEDYQQGSMRPYGPSGYGPGGYGPGLWAGNSSAAPGYYGYGTAIRILTMARITDTVTIRGGVPGSASVSTVEASTAAVFMAAVSAVAVASMVVAADMVAAGTAKRNIVLSGPAACRPGLHFSNLGSV